MVIVDDEDREDVDVENMTIDSIMRSSEYITFRELINFGVSSPVLIAIPDNREGGTRASVEELVEKYKERM